jgi:hypothetical protein
MKSTTENNLKSNEKSVALSVIDEDDNESKRRRTSLITRARKSFFRYVYVCVG